MGFKEYLAKKIMGLISLDELAAGLSPASFASMAGERVSAESAQRLFAVYACVNVLAETIATLPPKLYRTDREGNKEVVKDHVFARTLKRPNPTDTAFDFLERVMWHLALRGRFFAIKVRVFGEVHDLLPVRNPDSVTVVDTIDHGYDFIIDGCRYSQDDVFYMIVHDGKSIIRHQADTLGKNQAINRYGSSFFRNGAMPGLVIRNPNKFKDQDAFDRFRKIWEDTYGSARNGNKVAILDDGKTVEKISLTNEDSQFLDTNKYSDSQIAGLFRVPVYMIGNYDKATFSNIENLGQQFARFTIAPWCRRIESAISQQCLSDRGMYCEFLMDSLERGNLLSRYQAYQVGRNAGILSANEIRRKENMNPYEGGDEFLKPMNNTTAGTGG